MLQLMGSPLKDQHRYRVLAVDLLDENLTVEDLSGKVQDYAPKPVSAGMSIDAMSNLYLVEAADNAIGTISLASKEYTRLYESKIASQLLNSPSALTVGTASTMYVTNTQSGKTDDHHHGETAGKKYRILEFITRGPLYGGR